MKAAVPAEDLKHDLVMRKASKLVLDSAKATKAKKKTAAKKTTKKAEEEAEQSAEETKAE